MVRRRDDRAPPYAMHGGPRPASHDLVTHLAGFCGALRGAGLRVGLADEVVGAAGLTLIDLGDREDLRRAFLATLRIRPTDRPTFDALFAEWWRSGRRAGRTSRQRPPVPEATVRSDRPGGAPPPGAASTTEPGAAPSDAHGVGYSPLALLRRKPFEAWTERDLSMLDRVMARLVGQLATRRSRRLAPTRGRGLVDMRRSLRRMLATGGEPIVLAKRARPIERPRVVLLCDTSGSMDPHTKFLLAFALSLRRFVRRLHVFAFNTELTPITPWLSRRALSRTLARLARQVPDWSGGTRIGECFTAFVRQHMPWIVDSDTVVVILSDGLDRGDPRTLERAMAAIQRAARSVIWLNPLMGDPRYTPTARGMAAALPHVDHLAPAHNLESLERMVPLLTA
jgi:uncharacterized protein